MKFKTDAENQYFTRSIEPGELSINLSDGVIIDPSVNLWNGNANVTVGLPDDCKVGDIINYHYEVSDDTKAIPLSGTFTIKIIPKTDTTGGNGNKHKKPTGKTGTDTKDQGQLSLPNTIPVYQDNWGRHNFNTQSGLAVIYDPGTESYDFYYNADNVYLKNAQKMDRDDNAKVIDMQFKSSLVLVGMSILNAHPDDDNIEEIVSSFTHSITPVLLPIIRSLGSISDA